MQVANREKLLNSFFDLYSEKLEGIRERSEQMLTADDVININIKFISQNKEFYKQGLEYNAGSLFTDPDSSEATKKLKSILSKCSSDPYSVAADIMMKISRSKIFKNYNEKTAISSGLYYLYKNNIMVTMSKEELNSLSSSILNAPTNLIRTVLSNMREQLKEKSVANAALDEEKAIDDRVFD